MISKFRRILRNVPPHDEALQLRVSFNFINLFNHNPFLDPVLNIVGHSTAVGTGIWPALHGRNFAANDGVRIRVRF